MSELYHDYREPFSWRRTVGFAATFGIHAFAFIMLMAPIAPPAAKEKIKDAVVVVNFVEPPPPLVGQIQRMQFDPAGGATRRDEQRPNMPMLPAKSPRPCQTQDIQRRR